MSCQMCFHESENLEVGYVEGEPMWLCIDCVSDYPSENDKCPSCGIEGGEYSDSVGCCAFCEPIEDEENE